MSRKFLSPMNPVAFNALDAIYPMYMARLKDSKFRRYATAVRHLRERCYPELRVGVTVTDIMALCHTARLALGDDVKARQYVRGSLKVYWQDTVGSKTVEEWVKEDFSKNTGQLS